MSRRAGVREHKLRVLAYEDDWNVAGLIQELGTSVRGRTATFGIPRADAADALGRLGDPRAIPHLLAIRDDPEWAVRMSVFDALGLLTAKEAVSVLVDGLDDQHPYVRQAAAQALGRIGDPTVIPRLREFLDSEENGEARLYAVESLLLLGDEDARDRITEAFRGVPRRSRLLPRWKRLLAYQKEGGRLEPFFDAAERSR